MQILFAVLYIGFAVIVVSMAIWLGIWVADRLARPIGRLAGAADRVARGDLNARVHEEKGDDEIATLSRAFNRMTSQVQRQRDALLDVNTELDHRRRFTEAVIAGVTAGVVGLDPLGNIDLMNASALQICDGQAPQNVDDIDALLPGTRNVVHRAEVSPLGISEGRVIRISETGEREYLVRAACQRGEGGIEGYVLTLDDMTALVSAQRLAAWGDVAQRVAHEIRNPLTPIQLSAERLRRKFGVQVEDNRPVFDQCVDTIVRQVGQIRRMVEEFSNFARMPKPEFVDTPLDPLFSEVIDLHSAEYPEIRFLRVPEECNVVMKCDRGLVSQAFMNLVRNAAQSVREHHGDEADGKGRIEIRTGIVEGDLTIDVIDNGPGFPVREREKLTEPYVTNKKGGTGLGLAIVRRIVEDHGGTLSLTDATGDGTGAQVGIVFPKAALTKASTDAPETASIMHTALTGTE
jgi:two-component system nitrogen regulation sensor histidine kinase NtrY